MLCSTIPNLCCKHGAYCEWHNFKEKPIYCTWYLHEVNTYVKSLKTIIYALNSDKKAKIILLLLDFL